MWTPAATSLPQPPARTGWPHEPDPAPATQVGRGPAHRAAAAPAKAGHPLPHPIEIRETPACSIVPPSSLPCSARTVPEARSAFPSTSGAGSQRRRRQTACIRVAGSSSPCSGSCSASAPSRMATSASQSSGSRSAPSCSRWWSPPCRPARGAADRCPPQLCPFQSHLRGPLHHAGQSPFPHPDAPGSAENGELRGNGASPFAL